MTLKQAQTIVFWPSFWLYITLSTTILYARVFKILIKLVTHKLEMAELEVNSEIYFSGKACKASEKSTQKILKEQPSQ